MQVEHFPKSKIRYKIDGIPVPGCTTITGILPKEALVGWAAKMAATHCLENWQAGRAYTKEEIAKICDAAKTAHNRKKDAAAAKGTDAHALLEQFVKAAIEGKKVEIPLPADPNVANSVRLFLEWEKTSGIKWLHSEVVVGSKAHMFAGRFDAIGEINGKRYLIDFKTSSGIFYEMHVQAAGYQICCEEMGIGVHERLLLWLPKTGNVFRDVVVRTPFALDKKCFLSVLDIYHCIQDAEKILSQEAAA